MTAPKVIWITPPSDMFVEDQMWFDTPGGEGGKYIRADAPELLALVGALRKIADGNPTCDSPEADAQYGAAIARAALSAYEALK